MSCSTRPWEACVCIPKSGTKHDLLGTMSCRGPQGDLHGGPEPRKILAMCAAIVENTAQIALGR
jgi:hypothetical protein